MTTTLRRCFLGLLLLPALIAAAQAQQGGSGGTNAARHRATPYVILVSLDGFRHDYRSLHDTPALDCVASSGLSAEALLPVYPTLTFPNHYSIATGLYPGRHGIVDNTFYDDARERRYTLSDREAVSDGRWYGGDPLWVVAEKNDMVSAAFFFVGTEADIQGIRPTYWKRFNASIPGSDRVQQVIDWLKLPAESRPHLITLYFEHVDSTGHRDGIGTETMADAITEVDGYIGDMLKGISDLDVADDVYIIVVSDHGMANYRPSAPFILSDVINLDGITTVEHGSSVSLYLDEPDALRASIIRDEINERWQRGQAIIPGEAPYAWRVEPGTRFPDVIAQADIRASVMPRRGGGLSKGDHGWAPEARDMHGIFLAAGPRLPAGRRIGRFRNIDIYPMILELLGLPQTAGVDSDPSTLLPLLLARGQGQSGWMTNQGCEYQ